MIIGFSPTQVRFCSMHAIHLGICQWANASAILDLCDMNYFGPGAVADQLPFLTSRFNAWCRLQSIEYTGYKQL